MDLGKSIMDLFKERRKTDFADASDPMYSPDAAEHDPVDGNSGFYVELKKKRRTAVLRQMLEEAGYGDLAKSLAIKER